MTFEQIEQEMAHVANIKKDLLIPKKMQLHTGISGYNSPDRFGLYRPEGGEVLGVVSSQYEPMNLNLFLESVVTSLSHHSDKYDLSTLSYNEYKNGAKISLDVTSKPFEVKSKLLGDVFNTKIMFNTGFDGMTKTSLSFKTKRLTCLNGNKSWKNDISLSFKNTIGNVGKVLLLIDELTQIDHQIETYNQDLNRLANIEYKKEDINKFFKSLLGFDFTDYKDQGKKSRNIFDKINESVAIEEKELGMTAYTLLQGVTRAFGQGSDESYLFGSNAKKIQDAHLILLN
jgi:hypothetical protein